MKNSNRQAVKRNCLIDDFVIKRPKIQDNDVHNTSDEIVYKKKQVNLLDSSESEKSENENHDTIEEKRVLDYFNNSSLDEIVQINGSSEIKALEIIKNRPYLQFRDLKSKKINQKIIDGCFDILIMKRNLIELLKKCENISSNLMIRINPLLSNIELESFLGSENYILDMTKFLNPDLKLKSYQIIGINWLRIVHEEKLNGILADEMGLGKTVQTIAFLSYLVHSGKTGPHIVIVPSSTLNNWERELNRWCPSLKVIVYYGNQEERRHLRTEVKSGPFHVLLTTYTIAVSSKDDRLFIKKLNFYYGIFDEAHMLKNMLSNRYKYLSNFKIIRKILLTGTPLQNNFVELISLLSFVMPTIFMNENQGLKQIFQLSRNAFQKQISFDDEKIKQMKEMLNPFCLRRLKSQVLSHLPLKTVEIIKLPLSEDQSNLYKGVLSRSNDVENLDPTLAKNTVMELRKLSHHSLLVRNHYTNEILKKMSFDMLLDEDHITADKNLIFEDFSYLHDFEIHSQCLQYPHAIGKYKLSSEMLLKSNKIQYLDENLPKFINQGDKILIFSQFVIVLDILEEFLIHKHIDYLRLDGSTSVDVRQDFIDQFNENENIKVFILSTRAGGMGINLTSANVVILHDIDYNPYNDRQAEDRSHRLGQQKDVRVIKLISKGTIDECILNIANEKLKLDHITLTTESDEDGDENKSSDSENKDIDFVSLLKQAIDI